MSLKAIRIPKLRQKLGLLPVHYAKACALAEAIEHAGDPRKRMDGPMISRAKMDDQLAEHWVWGLLRLYELKPPRTLDRREKDHSPWFRLLAEQDLEAFAARVQLLGGTTAGAAPGSVWHRFSVLENGKRAAALAAQCMKVVRLDQPLLAPAGPARALPLGHWASSDAPARQTSTLTLGAGERISLSILLARALPSCAGPLHVMCFLDVRTGNGRSAYPLVPAPAIAGIRMPPPQSGDALYEIPEDPGDRNCLQVGNGSDEASFVLLVTARPLDPELLEDTLQEGQILQERLDLLARTLSDTKEWSPESWALMRLTYQVLQPN